MKRAHLYGTALGLAALAGGCRQILGLPDEAHVIDGGGNGGSGGQGGGPGAGGEGGGPAPTCPAVEPVVDAPCSERGLECPYENQCCSKVTYACDGMAWDIVQRTCSHGCPPQPPEQGASCACFLGEQCDYLDACLRATCSPGKTWQVSQEEICGVFGVAP